MGTAEESDVWISCIRGVLVILSFSNRFSMKIVWYKKNKIVIPYGKSSQISQFPSTERRPFEEKKRLFELFVDTEK